MQDLGAGPKVVEKTFGQDVADRKMPGPQQNTILLQCPSATQPQCHTATSFSHILQPHPQVENFASATFAIVIVAHYADNQYAQLNDHDCCDL
ncbi:hypothetical protein ACLKA6_015006 [Drosophila palustris]